MNVTARLKECERHIGYRFRRPELLGEALSHPSSQHMSNERMEFLGDSVLGVVAASYLLRRFPEAPPGDLTRSRAALVSRQTQARLSRKLNLPAFAELGKGMPDLSRLPQSVLANLLEAIVGAMYLDGGMKAVAEFLEPYFEHQLVAPASEQRLKDEKSQLQELAQRLRMGTPEYRVTLVAGRPHSRTFEVELAVGGVPYARGTGPNKKEAEKKAAREAFERLMHRQTDRSPKGGTGLHTPLQ